MLLKPMDNQYQRQACRLTKRSVWLLRCTTTTATTRHKMAWEEGLSSARGTGIDAQVLHHFVEEPFWPTWRQDIQGETLSDILLL